MGSWLLPFSGTSHPVLTNRQSATISIRPKPSPTMPCGIHIGTPAMSLARPIESMRWA